MYIAVKGGESAIEASHRLLDLKRRGDPSVPVLQVAQVREQMAAAVGRVMAEASLHDPELAALALVQAMGDTVEAAFLLRAYRTTLPRLGHTLPLDTDGMRVHRRVSAIVKDLPGGQILGPTTDYTQRLLDFTRLQSTDPAAPFPMPPSRESADAGPIESSPQQLPGALAPLVSEGLVEAVSPEAGDPDPIDITRQPPRFPLDRSGRLQMLARADEGWVLGLGYSTQRGYAHNHPYAGELRVGRVELSIVPDEVNFPVVIGEIEITECRTLHPFKESPDAPPQFTLGQGLVFGDGERKAMAMALVDRALRAQELGEAVTAPAQDHEFALSQGDGIEASGFVQHLKLPHYVTFESELTLLRRLRAEHSRAETSSAQDRDA